MSDRDKNKLLVRNLGRDAPPGIANLEVIREITSEEAENLKQAKRLILQFVNNWWWNQIVTQVNEIGEALDAARNSAQLSSNTINTSDTDRVDRAFTQFTQTVLRACTEAVQETESISSESQARETAAVLAKITTPGSPCGVVIAAAKAEIRPMAQLVNTVENQKVRLIATLSTDLTQALRVNEPINLEQLVVACANALELLCAHVLLAAKKALFAAIADYLKLQAECVFGEAVLAPHNFGETFENQGRLDLEKPPSAEIQALVNAIIKAEQIVRNYASRNRQASGGGASKPTSTAGEEGPSNTFDTGHINDSPETDAPKTSERGAHSEKQTEEAAPREGASKFQPVELYGLLEEAGKLPVDLEKRWSDLFNDESDGVNRTLLQRWSSLNSAMLASIDQRTTQASSQGYSTSINPSFPLDAASALTFINGEPDGQLKLDQLGSAELYAFREFTYSFSGLQKPSNVSITFPAGLQESWWDSGAFARLRSLSETVMEVHSELRTQISMSSSQPTPWQIYASKAHKAISWGLVDAALLYICRAIREIRAMIDDQPDNQIVALIRTQFAQVNELASSTIDIESRWSRGEYGIPCAAWPLIYFWRDWLLGLFAATGAQAREAFRMSSDNLQGPDKPEEM